MIRHAIFALVLIVAAFAGGAAINGPGLSWAHKFLFGSPSIIVDGNPDAAPAPGKHKQFPTASAPPLRVDLEHDEAGPRSAAKRDLARAGSPHPSEPPSTPAAPLIQIPGTNDPEFPVPPDPTSTTPSPAPAPVVDRSGPAPAPDEPPPSLDLPPNPGAVPAKSDPVARLASATSGAPEGMPGSASAPPTSTTPTTARDWGEIRKRMRTLGVTRYSIEAETDGRVRFSCVIPVEGLKAVGHHFEAEGDDEHQAAEAALKRVALWRATEAR